MTFILRGPSSILNIANVSNLVAKTTQNFCNAREWHDPNIKLIDWKPSHFLDYETAERLLLDSNCRDNSDETRRMIRTIARQESQLKQIANQGTLFGITLELYGTLSCWSSGKVICTHIVDRAALYDFYSGQFLPSLNKEFFIHSEWPFDAGYWSRGYGEDFLEFKKRYDEHLNIALQETQRRLSGAPSNAAVGIMTNFSR